MTQCDNMKIYHEKTYILNVHALRGYGILFELHINP